MTPEDTNRIVAAIDRNTDAIQEFRKGVGSISVWVFLLWMGICVVGCPRAKATPLLPPLTYEIGTPPLPPPNPNLQYWHTQWVPTDSGVHPQEVYAPALPRVEPELYVFASVGDPPRLETPEPGTWWLVNFVVFTAICVMILKNIAMESLREWELGSKRCARYRLALEEIASTDTDNGMIARKALEEPK